MAKGVMLFFEGERVNRTHLGWTVPLKTGKSERRNRLKLKPMVFMKIVHKPNLCIQIGLYQIMYWICTLFRFNISLI